jgi:hypothetical protein
MSGGGTGARRLRALARSGGAWAVGPLERVRERARTLHRRFVCQGLDAVLTAELQVPQRPGTGLLAVLRGRASNYERLRGLVRTIHAVPGSARLARRVLLDNDVLPFLATAEPLSFGSGTTVFRLLDGGRSTPRVLKVYRQSVGLRGERLYDLARRFRDSYESVSRWYGSDIVVPTQFTILHSPLRGYSAAACVQPYLPDAGEDFLARPDEEALTLLRRHPHLRHQFQKFTACTLTVLERERCCLDLLGHANLALTGGGGDWGAGTHSAPRLRVFDFGVFDLAPGAAMPPATRRRLFQLVRRMQMLSAAASAPSTQRG